MIFNKLYAKIKNFIKDNFVFLLSLFIIYLVLTFPLPYYIYNGGGILEINDRITIDGKKNNQDINLCYVNQLKGNVGTFLLSHVIPHWDLEKINDDDYDYEEELYRNKILLEESINNATINAYKKAGMEYDMLGEKVLVAYILDEAKTDLEVGDQIIKVNDNIIHSMDEFKNIVIENNFGEELKIEVMSKEKKKFRTATVIDIEGEKKAGVGIITNYILETNPNIEINFKGNEAGPSGGLMLTVAIYDRLTDSNISKNKKICGTGTIDSEGNVGEIGGVKYKLRGAVNKGCDIFIAPTYNFDEVKKEKKKNKYNIEIYEAKTFDETIDYLLKNK